MMEALGGWLKQIVLVVLLATFIDLLLPNRTMQRYVKLVVSLFILMTILSPVMQLFGSSANLRMLAATVDGWSVAGTAAPQAGGGPAQGKSIPALGEVLSEGERVARERNEHSLAMLAARLEEMVVEHVRSEHGIDAEADASLDLDADGLPVIRGIRIRVGAALAASREAVEAAAPEASSEAGTRVHPEGGIEFEPIVVEPVVVEPVRIGGGAAPALEPDFRPVPDAERERIASSVAKAWGIPAAKVKVE